MKYIVITILMLTSIICFGQDPQFSRFYSNSLYLAPSFAGITGNNRISMSYRNQWTSISTGYETYSVSLDHYFSKLNSGVGVLILRDEAGTANLANTNMGLLYSFDFKLTNQINVRPGINLSYAERSIDFDRLLWMDQISAVGDAPTSAEPLSKEKAADIDFASSVLVYHESFWGGLSVDHLLRPNQSLYYEEFNENNYAKIPLKYQVFGGYKYVVQERLLRPIPTILQCAFLYKQQEEFKQLDVGFYWYYSPMVLGIWYRGIPVIGQAKTNDAVILLAGIKTRQWNIGYSYDFTTSKLFISSGGSHEISLAYTFSKTDKSNKKRTHKMIPCPEF